MILGADKKGSQPLETRMLKLWNEKFEGCAMPDISESGLKYQTVFQVNSLYNIDLGDPILYTV